MMRLLITRLVLVGLVVSFGLDGWAKRRVEEESAAAGAEEEPTGRKPVSLFGTSLTLGAVLDQLARNQGLYLIIRTDVNLKKEIDIPTLKNVALEDALRVILTPIGYSSAINGNELIIFARYVRVFRVNVPMITQNWQSDFANDATVGSLGEAEGGGGGGDSNSSLGAKVALATKSSSEGLWTELEKAFATLLSKDGTFSVNRAAGLVTVNDKPYALDAVERYIEALNEEMAKQVVIEVRLAEVTFRDERKMGVDWNILYDKIAGMAVGAASTAGSALVKDQSQTGAISLSLAGVGGSAVLHALEEQGDVNLVSQPNLLVGNNLPALIQVGQIRTYVAAITQMFVPNAGYQTSLKTGMLSDGLIMSLLPRINDNDVTMAVSLVLQEVVSLELRTFGQNAVELPSFNRRSYSGVVSAKPGDTLVIAGLIDEKHSDVDRGVPFLSRIPVIGVLFGSEEYVSHRTELVILLTPKTIAAAAPSQHDLDKFLDLD